MHNFNRVRKMSWGGVGLIPTPNLATIGSTVSNRIPSSTDTLEMLPGATINTNTDSHIPEKPLLITPYTKGLLRIAKAESAVTNALSNPTVGKMFDMASSFIGPQLGYNGTYGGLLQMGDLAFNATSDAMMSINPLVGGIMKAGGFVSDVLTKWGGMGTDSMTKADAILGSKLLSLTPFGMINGWGGKHTQDFSANQNTIAQVGASYGGTVSNINDAASKADKKYGLFSNKARNKANNLIDTSRTLQNTMTNIANEAADMLSISTSMSDINHLAYGFNLNGGYDLRFLRAARIGGKLKFERLNQEIINVNNKQIEWEPIIIESFKPIITEVIEEFKLGGFIPTITEYKEKKIWEPIITEFKQGGKTEETKDSIEIETTLQNIIPEGALHARKHNMENTEGLTLKGIPVVDNDGEQLAEIELNEIIFTLEVTKKLEELYDKYKDYEYSLKEKNEVAIEAGKILVELILFNTDDRTGLIKSCKEGGIL